MGSQIFRNFRCGTKPVSRPTHGSWAFKNTTKHLRQDHMSILRTIWVKWSSRLNGLTGVWFILPAMLLECGFVLQAQSVTSAEYQVKAVFLFNFTQFVDWPAS